MASPLVDLSKLRIADGAIHYRIQQQDGSMQPMTCADTASNRLFVAWVQIHDGFIPKALADGDLTDCVGSI